MTPHQLADSYFFDLYNDADHVNRLVAEARQALRYGRYAEALGWLAQAARPAGLIEMRLRDTVEAIAKAAMASAPEESTDGR